MAQHAICCSKLALNLARPMLTWSRLFGTNLRHKTSVKKKKVNALLSKVGGPSPRHHLSAPCTVFFVLTLHLWRFFPFIIQIISIGRHLKIQIRTKRYRTLESNKKQKQQQHPDQTGHKKHKAATNNTCIIVHSGMDGTDRLQV